MDKATYETLRARIDRFGAWVDTKRGRNGWASYHPEEIPAELLPAPTNEEMSAVEVYEFRRDVPARYMVYVDAPNGRVTTWTGETLGTVRLGRESRGNFGDVRVPVTVNAINGKTYVGTYYKGAGDYARIRLAKAKAKA